jgi:hypothetical protein
MNKQKTPPQNKTQQSTRNTLKKKNSPPQKSRKHTRCIHQNLCFQAMNISNYLKKIKIYMIHIENKNTFCLTQAMQKKKKKSIQPMLVSCVLANH